MRLNEWMKMQKFMIWSIKIIELEGGKSRIYSFEVENFDLKIEGSLRLSQGPEVAPQDNSPK